MTYTETNVERAKIVWIHVPQSRHGIEGLCSDRDLETV